MIVQADVVVTDMTVRRREDNFMLDGMTGGLLIERVVAISELEIAHCLNPAGRFFDNGEDELDR